MHWARQIREEQAMLMRIAAILFALADLAERACHRSYLTCRLVFWLLRPAEVVASILLEMPEDESEPCGSEISDRRVDMMRLAWRFYELACIVQYHAECLIADHGAFGHLSHLDKRVANAPLAGRYDIRILVRSPDTS